MASWISRYQLYRYHKVNEGDMKSRRLRCLEWCGTTQWLCMAIIFTVTFISYQFAWLLFQHWDYFGVLPMSTTIRLKTSPHVFVLNPTFASPPSKEINRAWDSLMPKEGGFFTHPTIAPEASCLAVFHQIHCLDMIRQALYEFMDHGENKSVRSDAHVDPNHVHDIWHIGHCFDLIRQTLMCRPDITVEKVNERLGGVTGFGTEHQCVNWQELMAWMEIYE